jgi:hypothetical protein
VGSVVKFDFGQNPKIWCHEFNDLQTPKLSKKQLCDRTLMLPRSTTTHENRIYKATLLTALCIDKLVLDGQGDGSQQAHGFDGPGQGQKLPHPTRHILAGVVMGQRPGQVRHLV